MLTGTPPSARVMFAESAPYTRIFLPFQSATVRMGWCEKTCCEGQACVVSSLSPFLASCSVKKGLSVCWAFRCSSRLDGHEGQLEHAQLEQHVGEVAGEHGPDLGPPVEQRGQDLLLRVERGGGVDADLHPPARLLLHLGREGIQVDDVVVASGPPRAGGSRRWASPGRPRAPAPVPPRPPPGSRTATTTTQTRELLHRMPLSRQIGSTSLVSISPSAASAFLR